MRALIVSDIHANREAFEAVLSDAEGDYDTVICLGDLVGYGPEPEACVSLAADVCDRTLAGNHDLAACGRMDVSAFSSHARAAMEWTRRKLSRRTRSFLESLPTREEWNGLTLSHGSPADPVWGYILSAEDAAEGFAAMETRVCLFGHTHVPSAFRETAPGAEIGIEYGEGGCVLSLGGASMLLNPGSVGFPRDAADAHSSDSERRAAARYALLDERALKWEWRRVEYDLTRTAKRMRRAGLW